MSSTRRDYESELYRAIYMRIGASFDDASSNFLREGILTIPLALLVSAVAMAPNGWRILLLMSGVHAYIKAIAY